jgi:hypothetical protein
MQPESPAFTQENRPVERLEFAETGSGLFKQQSVLFRKHGEYGDQLYLRRIRHRRLHQHGRLSRSWLIFGSERHLLRHAAHRSRFGKNILGGRGFFLGGTAYGFRYSGRLLRLPSLYVRSGSVRRRIEMGRYGKDEPEQKQDTGQTKISKLWHGVDV